MPRLARIPGPKRGLRVLRGQVGTEQEMSFNRLIFALAFVIYFATAGQAIAANTVRCLNGRGEGKGGVVGEFYRLILGVKRDD